MPYIYLAGIGLLMLTCIIHAARNGNTMPWLYIIVFLPFLGSVAYIIVFIVPEMLGSPDAVRLKEAAMDMRDPERHIRKLKHEADLSHSVDARQRLADEYMRIGRAEDGLPIYRELSTTGFQDDPRLQMGFARALVETGNFAEAEDVLDRFQKEHPSKADAEGHLLYARTLAGQGKQDQALSEYEGVIRYFAGPEALCRYSEYLASIGRADEARQNFQTIVKTIETSPVHVRKLNKRWYQLAKARLAGR